MSIPVTDKLWQQLKFDDNFNEISYIDNKGLSYEYINPVTGELKFYKADGIDISQKLLNNIHNIKSNAPTEQLFVKLFSRLTLIKTNELSDSLFFGDKINKIIIAEHSIQTNYFYMKFCEESLYIFNQDIGFLIKNFLNIHCAGCLIMNHGYSERLDRKFY